MLFLKLMNKIYEGAKAISGTIGFNFLPKELRQVTFYSEGKNYWPHLKGLLETTLVKTNKKVCYVSSSLDDPGIKINHPNLKTFFIGMGAVRTYFFEKLDTDVFVTTMPDLHKYQIKRSIYKVHYIYVQHSLVSLHAIYRHGAFDHYDTICAAGPHHVEEIREIEKKYNLTKKKIIKLGYSRLDDLIKNKNKNKNNKDFNESKSFKSKTILIAPSWGSKCILESGLGKNLVNELLSLGYMVILRPHPQTIKFAKQKVDEIKLQHKNNLNFIYEENIIGEKSFYQSDLMISDWSGVAFEYAFAFNKPVIFCDVPKKINNTNYDDIKLEPIEVFIRDSIGVIWDGVSPIKKKIELCLIDKENKINSLINQHCYNIGNSDEVFAKMLNTNLFNLTNDQF